MNMREEKTMKESLKENQKKELKTNEKGITMVALVVMIIILIILALITIGTITGRLGILDISKEVAGTYGTEQNRSRLEALVEDTILKYDIVGEKLTTEKLAEEIEKEDWIKKAEVRKDEDGNPNDILVETEDGDNFQVEYDEETGEKHIHELGKSDGESFPEVEAEYERESTSIKAKAYDKDTGIEKIEIIYGGEIIGSSEGDTGTFKVSKSGIYTIKATANSGKVAYTTVRVSMKLRAPTIKITSQGKIKNGWYGGDGIPVEVTISTEDQTVTEVHYMLRGVTQQEDTSVPGQEARVTITNPGRTIITGYTKDGAGNESEYVTQDVKYDNVKPRIDKIEAEGEKGNNDWFISDVIVSAEKAEDANSGVAGYYYFVPTEEDIKSNKIPSIEEMTYVSGQDRKMTVRRNGRTTILLVIEDKAGNKSDVKTVAVKKDNEPPRPFNVSYTNVGPHSFDISAATTDEHSSVVMYRFFVNLNGEEILKGSSKDGKGTIGELEPKQTYIVYVEAEDEAGNKRISTNMQVTTKGEVLPPTIELACSYDETNGWYRGDVDVTIRDSSTDDKSDLASITYRVEGANELTQRTEPGRITTFKATEEGISNVIAFGTGIGGNITEESTKEIKLDKTAPEVPTINVTGGTDGLNGWYKKGPVTVTINAGEDVKKDGVTDISETKGVIYEITGAMTKTVTNPVQSGIQENITQDGITTITAQTVDNAGNVSEKCKEVQIKIDSTKPNVPAINITGGVQSTIDTTWYNSGPITVTITAGTDVKQAGVNQVSETAKIHYSAEGSKVLTDQISTTGSAGFTITEEGKTTIYAYTEDNAGNVSETVNKIIKLDTKAPAVPVIALSGGATTNGWYKQNVEVTITEGTDTAGANEISGTSGITYSSKGAHTNFSGTNVKSPVTFTISNNGTTTITAQTVDKAGNLSGVAKNNVVNKDNALPTAPTITLNPPNPNGSNGWYKTGDITATISATGKDSHSGPWQIEYIVTKDGASIINTTTDAEVVMIPITVNTDGTTVIKAKTIDKAGNKSTAEATATVKRDVTKPTKANLTVTDSDQTTISVTAEGEDTISGVASYEFQYKKDTETSYKPHGSIVKTTDTLATHTYNNLEPGTTYNLKVIVTDDAGNQKTDGTITTQATVRPEPKIGDYIDYHPDTENYTAVAAYTGYTGDQDFSTDSTVHWRIYSLTPESVELVSASTVNCDFYLRGANGYNNAVYLLNEACRTMYSSTTYGTQARSLNLKDIEKVTDYDPTSCPTYGRVLNIEYSWYAYYPNIFPHERGQNVGSGTETPDLDRSEQNNTYIGRTQGSTLTVNESYYNLSFYESYGFSEPYEILLSYSRGMYSSYLEPYWVATRFVGAVSPTATFRCLARSDIRAQVLPASIPLRIRHIRSTQV